MRCIARVLGTPRDAPGWHRLPPRRCLSRVRGEDVCSFPRGGLGRLASQQRCSHFLCPQSLVLNQFLSFCPSARQVC